MNRRSTAGVVVVPLALIVAGCGSGGTRTTALPSIAAVASTPDTPAGQSPSAAASATATPATQATPTRVTPTLITETIAPAGNSPTATATASGSATGAALKTYSNARYGFSAGYPADFTRADPPVDGDGELFNSPDQAASFTVSGVNNNNHQTVDAAYAAATAPGDTKITYANKAGNVITVSGVNNNRVVYTREVVGSGSIDSLMWTYPVADKATFDPVLIATVKNFRAGDVATSH